MDTAQKLLLGLLGGSADSSASFAVTTDGARTLAIDYLFVTAATTVDWGDGSQDVFTGGNPRSHAYAGAGTYRVRILQPLNVTNFTFETPGAGITYSFDSASLGRMKNVTNFRVNLSAARTSVFNSSDFTAWRPTYFMVYNGNANVSGSFNTADIAAWSTSQIIYAFTNPSVSFTITQADFNGLVALNTLNLSANVLTQAQVNAVLLGLYTAAQSKTTNGGTLTIDGTNAAPSGTYGAANPPTTGKAAAYELINDSNGVIAAGKEWVTITVTGGLP